jgi:opacity protein-like surface antigen
VQLGYNMQFGSFVVGVEGDINWVGRGGRGFRGGDTGAFAFGGEFFGNAPGTVVFADPFLINDPAEVPLEIRAREAGPAGTFYNGEVQGSGRHRSEWVSTLRGRLGFAFDRFMIYGTAGFAFQDSGGTRTSTTLDRTDCRPDVIGVDAGAIGGERLIPGGCVTTRNQYETRARGRDTVGAAYGLGVEWAALNNISIGLEWVRADFRDSEIAFVDPVLTAAGDRRATRTPVQTDAAGNPVIRAAGGAPEAVVRRAKVDDDVDMFKLKVNVRF